jgi:hypothetical protein
LLSVFAASIFFPQSNKKREPIRKLEYIDRTEFIRFRHLKHHDKNIGHIAFIVLPLYIFFFSPFTERSLGNGHHLSLLEMEHKAADYIENYSNGMKQKNLIEIFERS